MLIIKGCNALVDLLREDAFLVMQSLHRYMKSKIHEKDHTDRYYKYKGTNLDYWGEGYRLLDRLVHLPENKRKEIIYVVFTECDGESSFIYYFHKKYYCMDLRRKHRGLHKIMDRIQEIFKIEDETNPLKRKLKYLRYILT